MTPRGIRLQNPGNIRKSKDKWQGLAADQPDRDFFKFETPVWGIRAMARILINYQDKYDLVTPQDIISRWAPPADLNDTPSYVADVCKRCGWNPMTPIDVQKYEYMRPLVEAIIWHENGQQPYSSAQIDEGLKLSGIMPPAPPSTTVAVAQDPRVIGTAIGTAATGLASATGGVSMVWDTLTASGIDPRLILGCFTLLAALALVYFIVAKITARKEGRA